MVMHSDENFELSKTSQQQHIGYCKQSMGEKKTCCYGDDGYQYWPIGGKSY